MIKSLAAIVVVWVVSPFAVLADEATMQDVHQDLQAVSADKAAIAAQEHVLAQNDVQTRELDRQRNEALRVKNFALAAQLQKAIDQKHAARKSIEANLQNLERNEHQEKHEAEEQCSENTACAKERRHRELMGALENAQRQLTGDEAAAARIGQDKNQITQIQAQLRQ